MERRLRIRICGVVFCRFLHRVSKDWAVKDSALGWIHLTEEMHYEVSTAGEEWVGVTYAIAKLLLEDQRKNRSRSDRTGNC